MKTRLFFVSAALVVAPSLAVADTDSFTVSAEVESSCTIEASDLDFGTVNTLDENPVDGASTLEVTCTNDTAFEVGLDGGNSGDVEDRYMTNDSDDQLTYNLFADEDRTTVWGDTEGDNTVSDIGTGSAITLDVYAQIDGGQDELPAGNYDDTVTATVYY